MKAKRWVDNSWYIITQHGNNKDSFDIALKFNFTHHPAKTAASLTIAVSNGNSTAYCTARISAACWIWAQWTQAQQGCGSPIRFGLNAHLFWTVQIVDVSTTGDIAELFTMVSVVTRYSMSWNTSSGDIIATLCNSFEVRDDGRRVCWLEKRALRLILSG